MHTATQLERSQFGITVDGRPAELHELFPDWHPADRLGVVVHEPFGALGASHLIQLAIVAYYDARPSRRAGKLRVGDPLAVYPEVYLFHVGGRHGDHRWLDVFPPRKEVLVENDASRVLEALNDRAITRLAVPDGSVAPAEHPWKEPAAARDRIVSAFAYSATGRAAAADIEIGGLAPVTEFNVRKILEPEEASSTPVETVGLAAARRRREALRRDGVAAESFRRIELDEALHSLAAPGAAPGGS